MKHPNPKMEYLIQMTAMLAKHPGSTRQEISDELQISRATTTRLLASARQLGMKINCEHSQYYIMSWGIFNSVAVKKWRTK